MAGAAAAGSGAGALPVKPAGVTAGHAGGLRHHLLRPAVFMALTLWTCQLSSPSRGFTGRLIRPGANENRPAGTFPRAAAGKCCSLLPGNHSPGQGSRKPRRRVHEPGSLRCLARGHVSMVSRRSEGAIVFPVHPAPGAGPIDGLRAWMPRSCRKSCMKAATMPYGRAGRTSMCSISGHGSAQGAQGHQR